MDTVDFTKFCLLTGNKENLTTKMDIEHDGKIYKIAISEIAADSASIKKIKTKLVSVLNEVDELIARANDFGLHISYTYVTQQPKQAEKAAVVASAVGIPGKTVALNKVAIKDVDGQVQEVIIPKSVKDENGSTEINIIKTSNKELLEQGAAYNATDFRKGYTQGVQTKNCSACKGAGKVRISNSNGVQEIPCKKCGGLGLIS